MASWSSSRQVASPPSAKEWLRALHRSFPAALRRHAVRRSWRARRVPSRGRARRCSLVDPRCKCATATTVPARRTGTRSSAATPGREMKPLPAKEPVLLDEFEARRLAGSPRRSDQLQVHLAAILPCQIERLAVREQRHGKARRPFLRFALVVWSVNSTGFVSAKRWGKVTSARRAVRRPALVAECHESTRSPTGSRVPPAVWTAQAWFVPGNPRRQWQRCSDELQPGGGRRHREAYAFVR